jgi:hypothetical protein
MTAALEGGEWSAARPGRTLPPGKTRYPFYRRLGGPQGQSGRADNLVPTGIRSRTVQPVAQSIYRLSYPAHTIWYITLWNVIFNLSSFLSGSVWDGWNICRLVFGSLWYILEFLQETLENRHFLRVFFLLPTLKWLNRLNMKFESPVLGTSY